MPRLRTRGNFRLGSNRAVAITPRRPQVAAVAFDTRIVWLYDSKRDQVLPAQGH